MSDPNVSALACQTDVLVPIVFRLVVGVCIAPTDARPPSDAAGLTEAPHEYRYLRSIRDDRIFLRCQVPPRPDEFRARLSFDRALLQSIETI